VRLPWKKAKMYNVGWVRRRAASLHSPLSNRGRHFARPTGACLPSPSHMSSALAAERRHWHWQVLRVHITDGNDRILAGNASNNCATSPHSLLVETSLSCSYAICVYPFMFPIKHQEAGLRGSPIRYSSSQNSAITSRCCAQQARDHS
jgi:hypothetical protein